MAGANPHAASGTGSPRNPYLYDTLDAYKAGVALDPFSLHALAPEVRESLGKARASVIEAWTEQINIAVAMVAAGKPIPTIGFTSEQ